MDYKVATEQELIAALKKIAVMDSLVMSEMFYLRQREYIKMFCKNRKFSFQEATYPRNIKELTFYETYIPRSG